MTMKIVRSLKSNRTILSDSRFSKALYGCYVFDFDFAFLKNNSQIRG